VNDSTAYEFTAFIMSASKYMSPNVVLLKKALGTITGIGNLLNESVEAVDIIDRR